MSRSFILPDLGEGVHEAEIVAVLVAPGDVVKEDQPILEVETDKATVEIPSPYAGVVTGVNVKVGDIATVGQALVTFADTGEVPEETAPPQPPAPTASPAPGATPRAEGPVPATPATRRLARELGVDLRQVPPSGPGGRVTSEDVRAYAARAEAPAPTPAPLPAAPPRPPEAPGVPSAAAPALVMPDFGEWGPVERVHLRSVRRATAKHLAVAWSQIPHVHHMDQADITDLEAVRSKYKAEIEAQGGRLTLTAWVLKAVVAGLKAHPMFNASLDVAAEEIIYKRYYHIGVATDTERGLIVPVIRDVDRKSITQLAVELAAMAERVRAGRAAAEELRGGTFTVTNIGALGGTGATPIINYPEVAILALGAARWQAVVREGPAGHEIVPRLILPLTLGFDHRVADGADAARFMKRIIELLENPERMLLNI